MRLVVNRSYTYVIPMLDWWENGLLLNGQLRGCFIGDVNHPELDSHILLLYKFTGERWFTSFERTMQDTDHFAGQYDPDKRHVMFIYNVPPHQKKNYDLFRASKYSQISEKLKRRIVAFHGQENTRKVAAVMYRDESMYKEWEDTLNDGLPRNMHVQIPRDQEATSALNMADEVYNDRLKVYDALEATKESFFRKESEDDE